MDAGDEPAIAIGQAGLPCMGEPQNPRKPVTLSHITPLSKAPYRPISTFLIMSSSAGLLRRSLNAHGIVARVTRADPRRNFSVALSPEVVRHEKFSRSNCILL